MKTATNILLITVYFLTFVACPFFAGWSISTLYLIVKNWPH